MSKKTLSILENIFCAEINNELPFQKIGPKAAQKLVDEGYIQPMQIVLGGRFPVPIKGWQLTHLGRMSYCMTCKDEGEL